MSTQKEDLDRLESLLSTNPSEQRNLKPTNIHGRRVTLFGLQSAPQLNSAKGTVVGPVGHGGRWRVLLDSDNETGLNVKRKEISVRLDNLELADVTPTLPLFIVGMETALGKGFLKELVTIREKFLHEKNIFLAVAALLDKNGGSHFSTNDPVEIEKFLLPTPESPFGGASDEALRIAISSDLVALSAIQSFPYIPTAPLIQRLNPSPEMLHNPLRTRVSIVTRLCALTGMCMLFVNASSEPNSVLRALRNSRKCGHNICSLHIFDPHTGFDSSEARADDFTWLKPLPSTTSSAILLGQVLDLGLEHARLPLLVDENERCQPKLSKMRTCFSCQNIVMEPQYCSRCSAVCYCSRECQLQDSHRQHGAVCRLWATFMERDTQMRRIHFPHTEGLRHWSAITLGNEHKTVCEMLCEAGLHDGIYLRICKCECGCEDPYCNALSQKKFGELANVATRANLLFPPDNQVNGPLDNWAEYYQARGLSENSPLALLLTFPLTVFHIITKVKKLVRYPQTSADAPEKITIHYLGPEVELDLIDLFCELLVLLPKTKFEFLMIGTTSGILNKAPISRQGSCGDSSILFQFFQGFYHDLTKRADFTSPDIVIGLNASLAAPEYEWTPTINKLLEKRIPAVFSDYCENLCENPRKKLALSNVSLSIPVTVNPFRQPLAFPGNDFTPSFPWYSNGFLFGLN